MKRLFTELPVARSAAIAAAVITLALLSLWAFKPGIVWAQLYPNEETTDEQEGSYPPQDSYCRELERKLASDWVRGRASGNFIPDLNQKIRDQDALFNKLQNTADDMDCYESMFIFGRTLRHTKKCEAIDRQIRDAKRELARLQQERDSIRDSRDDGNRRKRLIDELARNNCGEQYRYESQRNSAVNWFGDGGLTELFGPTKPRSRDLPVDEIQPYATYRTMCVRLCDGFYYPVSFSTLPSNFEKDLSACQTGCAAPAELYVYRNPGGEVEQMISPDGRPYEKLENAWRFRKEFVKGCSCKAAEYSEAQIAEQNAGVPGQNINPAVQGPAPQTVPLPSGKNAGGSGGAKTIDDLIR